MSTNFSSLLTGRDLTVSIAGLDGVGKTSIVQRLLREDISEIYKTFGVNTELLDLEGLKLGLTDLGGSEAFRKVLWKAYISRSDAFIYVVDATNSKRLEESRKWFVKALQWVKKRSPVLVLVNTWDAHLDNSELDEITKIFTEKINSFEIECFSISPVTGKNIEKTKDWLANSIINHLIAVGITVDYFVAYIRTGNSIIEAKIRTPQITLEEDILFPIIKYRFANEGESMLEYMKVAERQIIMAADENISCWLVTTKSKELEASNLLMRLLTELVSEISCIAKTKKDKLTEADLTSFLINHMIDRQIFWSESQSPMFEISVIDTNN